MRANLAQMFWFVKKKISGQENRRHPETPVYRCFLSDLTGFAGLRRAGPTRTGLRIPDVGGDVNNIFVKSDKRIVINFIWIIAGKPPII
jgi:hypothetical protein